MNSLLALVLMALLALATFGVIVGFIIIVKIAFSAFFIKEFYDLSFATRILFVVGFAASIALDLWLMSVFHGWWQYLIPTLM